MTQDPSGSNLECPILGIQKDKVTGLIRPLAGSMEESSGKGLIPINFGHAGVDTLSGKHRLNVTSLKTLSIQFLHEFLD